MTSMPVALTVAGSDSGGGAGIQADLRTFAALRVFGCSAITAITAQNTSGVTAVELLTPALVRAQVDAVLADFAVGAIKTGMLGSAELVRAVAEVLGACRPIPLVVDPVMVAKSGAALLSPDAVAAVRHHLLPLAALITPNLPEAEHLLGQRVVSLDDQVAAARALVAAGAGAALIKGGHAEADPVDVLWDGATLTMLRAPRQATRHTHGTGCTYAAAITALLARGLPLTHAVRDAHAYLQAAIAQAPGLGHGHGPVHHMHPWYPAV